MINIDSIKQFYELLGHRKQTEIRGFELSEDLKTGKCKINVWVNNQQKFIDIVKKSNGKYNLYAGLNERKELGSYAKDVISVKNLFLDIDSRIKPANEESLKEAEEVTNKVISDINKRFETKPSKIFSGNGYQLIYSIPNIDITKENRDEVQAKIQQFTQELIDKHSTDKVKLDKVGDLPRIIRITGTTNIKGGNVSKFIEIHKEESQKLKDYILNLNLDLKTTTKLKDKTEQIELNKRFYEVLSKDNNVKKLYEGDFEGYDLSIGGELGLVCYLIQYDFNKQEIFNIMASSKIGRWKEKGISYREETYNKALASISKEKKISEQPKIIAHEGDLDIKTIKDYVNLKLNNNYIVENFLHPKTLTMVYSPPANFKSLIIEDLSLSVAKGTEFMGLKTKKQNVLYCDGENADLIVKERLLKFCKGKRFKRKPQNFFILKNGILMDEKKNVHLGFLMGLEKAIEKHKIKLLVFDTMHRFAFYDENRADDINMLYTKVFKHLIDNYGITIVFLHHSKKDGGYRGSGDFLGMVDVSYKVIRNGKTDKFKIINEKCRSGEIDDISGEITFGESFTRIDRLDEEEESDKAVSKLKELTERVKTNCPLGIEVKNKDIEVQLEMQDYDYSKATLKRVLKWLVDKEIFEKTNKGVYRRIAE